MPVLFNLSAFVFFQKCLYVCNSLTFEFKPKDIF